MPSYEPPSQQALDWVRRICGGQEILGIERLVGGITADMDRITVSHRDGDRCRVVLRRWSRPWGETDALIEREARALEALAGQGIPAPRLIGTDPTAEQAGVQSVLMTEVPGTALLDPPDLQEWLGQLATTLAAIHALPPVLTALSEGWFTADRDYSWIADDGLRRDALELAQTGIDTVPRVFTHGDYQHFNVLWSGRRLTGVVDWTTAGIGPRGTDVGHCRLNLAVLFSADAADTFLALYQAAAGATVDAGTELRSLLNWGPEWMDFIPVQVAERAPVDLDGMRDRVVETIRRTLTRSEQRS